MIDQRPSKGRLALAGFVFFALLGYVVWPQLLTYLRAFGVERGESLGGLTLDPFRATLASSLNRAAIWNSVAISLWSVALAGILGAGTALLCERLDFPGRKLVLAAAALPLALPPLIGVMAIDRLVGFSGAIPRWLANMTGAPKSAFAMQDAPAILLVHAYSFSVYFFVLTRAGLAGLDGNMERAAASLGASRWTRLRRVTLPALAPYLIGAALMTFMISMGSYSAPKYLASGKPYVPYLTVEIATNYLNGDYAASAALASILSAICLGALAALQFGFGQAWRQQGGGAKGAAQSPAPPKRVESPASRALLLAASCLFLLAMAAPLASILVGSIADMRAWNQAGSALPPAFTLSNYRDVFRGGGRYAHPILVSLYASGAAMGANLLLATATAWIMARGGRAARLGADLLSTLPLALPGTVIAFNLAVAFGSSKNPSWLTFGQGMRNTLWILALVYFARQIPLALRPVGAAMAKLDPLVESAARSLGAGPWRTFRLVVLPSLRNGLLASALICFVSGMGEFVASVLVSSTRWRPISIEIAGKLADSDGLGPACAHAALLMFATSGALVAYGWLTRQNAPRSA